MDRDVKDLLERMAREVAPAPTMPRETLRRSRLGVALAVPAGIVGIGVLVVGLALGIKTLAARTEAPAGTPQPTAPAPTPSAQPPGTVKDLSTIRFVDALHGWAGGQGTILSTDDGGATWTRRYSGPADIVMLEFVNPDDGWAVTRDDGLLRTVDAGSTWTPAGEPGGLALRSVDFSGPSEGWGIAQPSDVSTSDVPGALVRTTDGGQTWTIVRSRDVQSVCAVGHTVYAGTADEIQRSDDAGSTWTTVSAPHPSLEPALGLTIQCPTESSLWVLFTGDAAAGSVAHAAYRSVDGGATWSTEITGMLNQGEPGFTNSEPLDAYPGPFAALSADQAVFLGQCPACEPRVSQLMTSDGGESWTRQTIDGYEATALSFADPAHGWMAARIGPARHGTAILATEDGGASWHEVFRASP